MTQQSTLLPSGISVKTKRNKTVNGAADGIKERLSGNLSLFSDLTGKVGRKGDRRKRCGGGGQNLPLHPVGGTIMADVEEMTHPDG